MWRPEAASAVRSPRCAPVAHQTSNGNPTGGLRVELHMTVPTPPGRHTESRTMALVLVLSTILLAGTATVASLRRGI